MLSLADLAPLAVETRTSSFDGMRLFERGFGKLGASAVAEKCSWDPKHIDFGNLSNSCYSSYFAKNSLRICLLMNKGSIPR